MHPLKKIKERYAAVRRADQVRQIRRELRELASILCREVSNRAPTGTHTDWHVRAWQFDQLAETFNPGSRDLGSCLKFLRDQTKCFNRLRWRESSAPVVLNEAKLVITAVERHLRYEGLVPWNDPGGGICPAVPHTQFRHDRSGDGVISRIRAFLSLCREECHRIDAIRAGSDQLYWCD